MSADLGPGADVVRVEDPGDERLADYLHLTDVALRRKLEPASGLYMAESSNVIARAVAAGHRPRSFLMAPRWLESMASVIAEATGAGADPAAADGGRAEPVPVFVAEEPVLREVTGFHLHRGALAAMHRPELPTVEEILDVPAREPAPGRPRRRRLVVLEDIVDHTNVGAIFRSAAAMGAHGVLVSPSCADPLYRRSVRVSMGGVFQVPWTRASSWPGDLAVLRAAGYTTAALALTADAVGLDEVTDRLEGDVALVLGAEGDGLAARTIAACDLAVKIPMAGGVDSLNVAAAAAVALWATRS